MSQRRWITGTGAPYDIAAAILFDRRGHTYSFTDDALRLLSDSDAVELRGGRLHARDQTDDARLQRVIEGCTREQPASHVPAAVRSIALRGRSSQLILRFTALTEQGSAADVTDTMPRALALISASTLFDFTVAENAVAELLWAGLPLRKIAEQRGTSLETVRTQAKAIYSKLGVQSRTQMMAAFGGRDTRATAAPGVGASG